RALGHRRVAVERRRHPRARSRRHPQGGPRRAARGRRPGRGARRRHARLERRAARAAPARDRLAGRPGPGDRAAADPRAPLPARGRALRVLRAARAPRGEVAMRRLGLRTALLALLALLAVGCGEKVETGAGGAAHKTEKFNIVLDYFPNADHAGLYAAQAAG